MHAETPRLASKTIIFSEHEGFKVVVMVIRRTFKNIFKIQKSPKISLLVTQLLIFQK